MTVTVAQFRQGFTAFQNPDIYPDAMVKFWLTLGYVLCSPEVWNEDLVDAGAQLYAEHNCVLEAQAARVAKAGGIPTGGTGAISSKSGDGLSVSFDTAKAAMDGWGPLNLTNYGTRLAQLAEIVGITLIGVSGTGPLGPVNAVVFGVDVSGQNMMSG